MLVTPQSLANWKALALLMLNAFKMTELLRMAQRQGNSFSATSLRSTWQQGSGGVEALRARQQISQRTAALPLPPPSPPPPAEAAEAPPPPLSPLPMRFYDSGEAERRQPL